MNQTTLEKSVEELHAELREKARQQGVKPIERVEDLYLDYVPEDFNVDEFLEMVREIRQGDFGKESKI